jgi:hypothetical protein
MGRRHRASGSTSIHDWRYLVAIVADKVGSVQSQWLSLRGLRRAVFARAYAMPWFCFAPPTAGSQSAKLVPARADEAANCGEESALRHAVACWLGDDPFVTASDSTVVAVSSRVGGGHRERVFVTPEPPEKRLSA